MKKKTSIFFALLFFATMAFSFGIASKAHAVECCPMPFECPGARGHKVDIGGGQWICVRDYTHGCDLAGNCS